MTMPQNLLAGRLPAGFLQASLHWLSVHFRIDDKNAIDL